MDALTLLKFQHRQVAAMFKLAKRARGEMLSNLFIRLADELVSHQMMEERIFYPATLSSRNGDALEEALQEHLQMKRLMADMLDLDVDSARFKAKLKVLEAEVLEHVDKEERTLFRSFRRRYFFHREKRRGLGRSMKNYFELVREGEPRREVVEQTQEAPSLQ
jgi:iron-sulfur cluster repair protein YtfE (RIC family)